jgi:hypothetical protein
LKSTFTTARTPLGPDGSSHHACRTDAELEKLLLRGRGLVHDGTILLLILMGPWKPQNPRWAEILALPHQSLRGLTTL